MTDTQAFLAEAHERARNLKTERVTEHGAKAPMPFVVVANRGSQYVATFFPHDRDEMIWVMGLAMGGFGCDLVAGTTDAYMVVADETWPEVASINPDTSEPWAPGDMEVAFKKRRPWVQECITTHAIDKVEQRQFMLSQTYKAKHYKIRWNEVSEVFTEEGERRAGGLVPDALRRALQAPDMMARMQQLLPDMMGLSPLEARAHADAVCIRMVVAEHIPLVYNVDDPDVRGILELSLGDDERNAAMGAPGLKLQPLIPSLQDGEPS